MYGRSPESRSRSTPPPTPVSTDTNSTSSSESAPASSAVCTPCTVNIPRPMESASSMKISNPRWLSTIARRSRGRNSSSDTPIAARMNSGVEKIAGGVLPSVTSRRMPPPTAVTVPIIATPKMSIPLRMASSAPDAANDTVPSISRIWLNSSIFISPLRSFLPCRAASPRAAP